MRSLQCYFLFVFMICQLSLQTRASALTASSANPVCGNNGSAYQQFPNEQLMNALNPLLTTTKTIFKLAPLGCCLLQQGNFEKCDSKQAAICAIETDTKYTRSFRNICLMQRTACEQNVDWRFLKHGNCENKNLSTLNCLIVYKPVCATYAGVKSTFPNECLVRAENTRKGADWRIHAQNVCEEDYIHRVARDIVVSTNHNTVTAVRNFENVMDLASINAADVTYMRRPAKFVTAVNSDDNNPDLIKSIDRKASDLPDLLNIAAPLNNVLTNKSLSNRVKVPNTSYGIELKENRCFNGSKVLCGLLNTTNTLTFGNSCNLKLRYMAQNTTWTYLHDVNCHDCRFACMEHNYNPICAVRNGISYTLMNKCFMEHSICLEGENAWKLLHEGECKSEAQKPIMSVSSSARNKRKKTQRKSRSMLFFSFDNQGS